MQDIMSIPSGVADMTQMTLTPPSNVASAGGPTPAITTQTGTPTMGQTCITKMSGGGVGREKNVRMTSHLLILSVITVTCTTTMLTGAVTTILPRLILLLNAAFAQMVQAPGLMSTSGRRKDVSTISAPRMIGEMTAAIMSFIQAGAEGMIVPPSTQPANAASAKEPVITEVRGVGTMETQGVTTVLTGQLELTRFYKKNSQKNGVLVI